MDDFEKELKIGFLDEAAQLLADAEQGFLSLESNPSDPAILDKIFRLAHNLKGSAKAVGFAHLGELTHELESYLIKVRSGEIAVQASSVSLLLKCNDEILQIIEELKKDLDGKRDCSALIAEIRMHIQGQAPVAVANAVPVASALSEQEITAPIAVAVPTAVEEIAESMPVTETPIRKAAPTPPAASADESIRVSLSRLEKLLNFVGEMVILQTVLREQSHNSNPTFLRKTIHQLGKVTKEVQDLSMSLRMVPLKQTFQKMQRIVRDTSGALGKKVNLVIQGEETEVDKTVLDNLSDPLVHLIRNAVDHGIESMEARKEKGKPDAGEVRLNAYHQSGHLVIEIVDDGGGLDAKKLREKAIEKGILREGANLTDEASYQLIFAPGFSTKAVVTDVSGRGVGMDVVKTNIEKLQGEIQIETTLGKGTCFRIRLPLTLAIIDGMVVQLDRERYVIPLSQVHESVRPGQKDVQTASGLGEVFILRGEVLPLRRLGELLGRKLNLKPATESIAIVLRINDNPFAVLVDDIIGQQQVVIKQLGQEHQNTRGISGSAILGDGKPALILELTELALKQKKAAR